MSVPKVEGQHVLSKYFFFYIFDLWSIVKLRGVCRRSWDLLGPLGVLLGASWGGLGASWGLLGGSWALLGASWGALGASWAPPGVVLEPLGASWAGLGASWGGPKSIKKSTRKSIRNRVGSGWALFSLDRPK